MFKKLTDNLNKIFDKLRSVGVISESHINESMREIRVALIEADVSLPVIKDFIEKVKIKALGAEVIKSVSPGQMIVKIINDELVDILTSNENQELNLNSKPPVNILMVGLQGSGKTTATGKLAEYLKKQNKKILLVSLDTYRPAAQEQLKILADSTNVDSLEIVKEQKPIDIAHRALNLSAIQQYDVVIYDTAGRLHIDQDMISEVEEISQIVKPTETLLVLDSMIGQESINVATKFNEALSVSGMILSRIDGDARGGVALSAVASIQKPIKFLSTGEKTSDFEKFDPKRMASRILDMGDVVSLVEKASELIDEEEVKKASEKLKKGKFDLNDYISQLKMIKKMGGLGNIMNMIPGISKLTSKMDSSKLNDNIIVTQEAMVLSMTPKERRNPKILNASRRKRIAAGSGTSIQQLNSFLKQYDKISSVLKKASKMDQKSLMRGGIERFFS